jgi:hypothetical protein
MVSGLAKHTRAQDASEIDEVRRRAHQMIPHTPTVDVVELLAKATAHLAAALKWKVGAAANLQAAQIMTQTDPGEEADAACHRAHAALDAAEADANLANREVASYQLRVWQARVDEDVP